MSITVLVLGPTGSGKSTSTRTLDPKTTFFINVLDKPLPFRGYSSHYKQIKSWEDKEGNYLATDDWQKIIKCIQVVDSSRPEIQTLIIDDLQYVLANEFMRRISERGFDKFSELANHFWQIINTATKTRRDLISIFLSHNEVDNMGKSKCKTIGKLLDEKITVEGMFTIVLHTLMNEEGFNFITQSDNVHTAKSPLGLFDDKIVPNDLKFVTDKVREYFN